MKQCIERKVGWQERKEFISNIFANKNDHEEDLFGEKSWIGKIVFLAIWLGGYGI